MDVAKTNVADVMATWEADELKVRANLGHAGVASPA